VKEKEKIEEEEESLRQFERARGRGYSKKSNKSTGVKASGDWAPENVKCAWMS
jgi:hypothetical protein